MVEAPIFKKYIKKKPKQQHKKIKNNNKNKKEKIKFITSNRAPEGFQNIEEHGDIQFAEVYLSTTNLGLYEIQKKQNKIYFLNSENKIYNRIINKLNLTSPLHIQENILSGVDVFYSKCTENCFNDYSIYATKNESVYIIYINPLLIKNTKKNTTILPEPTTDLALVNSTNAYYNNTNNQNFYNWNNETVLSYKNNRFINNWTINDSYQKINESYYSKDTSNFLLNTGLYNFTNQSTQDIYGTPTIFGISLSTNYKNFSNNQREIGEAIDVFLDSRSKVEIFKEGRLYFSGIYDQGIQNLYIPKLPTGSYFVDVVITDLSTNTKTNYREFYSKNSFLPVKGKNLYFFDAGVEANRFNEELTPELTNREFFRAGEKRKLYKNIGTYNEISHYSDTFYYSPSLFWVTTKGNVNISYYQGDNGNNGFSALYTGNLDNTKNINLSYRKNNYEEPALINKENNQNFIINNNERLNFNFNHNLKKYGNYSIGYSMFENDIQTNSQKKGEGFYIRYSKNLNHNKGRSNISLAFNKEEDNDYITLRYNYYFRNNKNNHNIRYGYTDNREEKNEIYYSLDRQTFSDTISSSYNFNVFTDTDSENYNIAAQQSNKKIGNYSFNINKNSNNNGLNTTLNFENTTTYTKDGGLSFGLNNGVNNGVVIDLRKYKDFNKNVLIKVNGIDYSKVQTGEAIFIPLEEYKEYYISTEIENSIEYKTKSENYKLVLYKNNIEHYKPEIFKIKLYLSQFTHNNKPLKNKIIKTSIGSFLTDKFGYSQIEINSNNPKVNIENYHCNINLDSTNLFIQTNNTKCIIK